MNDNEKRQTETLDIEITPDMIKAGVSALCSYDSEFESREEGVTRIFEAMCRASRKVGPYSGSLP
jgi:hypothetical protein